MADYSDLRTLFEMGELLNKTDVACVVAANTIRGELESTPNHTNRIIWARQTVTAPRPAARQMLMVLLAANKDQSLATIKDVSDATLQTLVNAAVDLFADGS